MMTNREYAIFIHRLPVHELKAELRSIRRIFELDPIGNGQLEEIVSDEMRERVA